MKTDNAMTQKILFVLIAVCAAATATGSILFAVFADFLAQFPANGF